MPKTLTTLFMLCVVGLGQVGCDSQASQQAQAQRLLTSAIQMLQQANRGYVPPTEAGGKIVEGLQTYRQQTMDTALANLDEVMKLDAPSQKLQALRLSAEIHASAARYEARAAAVENAVLAGRSSTLMGYLSAFEGSASRSVSLQPHETTALAKLQEETDRQNAKRQDLQAQASQLSAELKSVMQKMAQFRNLANEGYAKAQTLKDRSFVAQGQRKFDLQDQASKLQRQAAIQSAAAEHEQVAADSLSSRLELVQSQLALIDQLLIGLDSQSKDIRTRAAQMRDESAAAATASAQAGQTMADEFNQIADVHDQAVHQRMIQAAKRIDRSVGSLNQAVGLTGNNRDKQAVRLQLLSAYVDQAQISTSHAIYLGGLANTTRVLAESVQRLSPQEARVYTERLEKLVQAQAKVNDQAGQAIEAGRELAAELAPEGSDQNPDPATAIALQQLGRLEIYDQRRYEHEVR